MASPRTLLILYGSETGTAADLAADLARASERLHFTTTCLDANSLQPPSSLASFPIVIFVTSTTGQGEMPSNMRKFWKFLLRKRLPGDWLQATEFTTFGCGDTTYIKYNWAAKKVHKRFLQLGARELGERGEGDEQHTEGIDGSFLPWSTRLWEVMSNKHPLPPGVVVIPEDQLLPPKYFLELQHGVDSIYVGDAMTDLHVPRPGTMIGTVTQNQRMTPDTHWQDVRHITITLPEPVSYAPGDAVALLPKNFPTDVDHFLSLQSWTNIADTPLCLRSSPEAHLIPSPIPHAITPLTLRTLLTHHLDIASIPRRSFFTAIATLTTNPTHKERLQELTNPAFLDDLYNYTTRPRRSILEVLQEFSSVQIPLSRLLDVVPRVRERLFSIASSARGSSLPPAPATMSSASSTSTSTKNVELLVAIVKYKTIIKKTRQGVCTRWLSSLSPGSPISVAITPGALLPPVSSPLYAKPTVMISPGTGLAPMRALIWERILAPSPLLENTLFFGSRNRTADFFFECEWEALAARMGLQLFTAFSRDQAAKRYVQTAIREQAGLVWEKVVVCSGVVYVCGSSGRMPTAVREALVEVFEKMGGWDRGQSEGYLLEMEREGRFRQETW